MKTLCAHEPCGQDFTQSTPEQRYCSKACRTAAHHDRRFTATVNVETGLLTVMRGRARGTPLWSGIVKVQRSIDAPDRMLVYNEDRTVMMEKRLQDHVKAMFAPSELKFYAQARYENGVVVIGARVEAQAW